MLANTLDYLRGALSFDAEPQITPRNVNAGAFGDYETKNQLYVNAKEAQQQLQQYENRRIVSLAGMSEADVLQQAARDDATGEAFRFALMRNSPVVFLADNYTPPQWAGATALHDAQSQTLNFSAERLQQLTQSTLASIDSGIRNLAASGNSVFTSKMNGDGSLTTTERDVNSGALLSATNIQTIRDADGNLVLTKTTTLPNGDHTVTLLDADGRVLQRSETITLPDGIKVTTIYDGTNNQVSRGTLETVGEGGATTETIRYADGRTLRIESDSDGRVVSRTETIPTATGQISTTRYYALGTTVRLNLDKSGNILERIETIASPTGPAALTVYDGSGATIGQGILTTYEDGSTSETVRYTDGRTIRTNADENGAVSSRASIQYFEEDGSIIETVTYADGRIVKLSYDGDGALVSQENVESGSQTLQKAIGQYGGTLLDALTLVKAIQSGEPLPIVASGLKIANDLSNLNGTPNLDLSTGANQTFRPVALDLDGDGIEVTDKAHGVAFDVDDSGYLKQSAWIKGDDALLVLDRNYNGQFDSGKELFSNGTVSLSRRGLAGMAWVDANYDGRLTADDPVWNELKLWRDLNQDGQQEDGEVQTLNALGVTELNYAMSTFTQNGVKKQWASSTMTC